MFFVLLRPIFCEKWKIAPPHTKRAPPQTFELAKLGEKSPWILVKTFFFFFFFFGDHLILGGKNVWISAEKSLWILEKTFFFFFFGDHLILGGKNLWISDLSETFRLKFRTNHLKLIQGQWKFESTSFAHFSLFQNSPPPFSNPGYAPVLAHAQGTGFHLYYLLLLLLGSGARESATVR